MDSSRQRRCLVYIISKSVQNTHYNPTIIRKSFASNLVLKKVNIKVIQELMGHINCETTLKYYIHFSDSEIEKIWKETNPYGNNN